MKEIRQALISMADERYKQFQCRLIPNVDPCTVLGVRTPALRAYAKSLSPEDADNFMAQLPHTFYDENNLHACLIERIKDIDECLAALDRFLPYVDNWATCDMMRPKVLSKHKQALFAKCEEWLTSPDPFTVRYALEMRMLHGLTQAFDPLFLEQAATLRREEYYVRMMVAWFFATALTVRYEDTIPYLEQRRLETWVHNKTIQKACDSRVIPKDKKDYLKTLKG